MARVINKAQIFCSPRFVWIIALESKGDERREKSVSGNQELTFKTHCRFSKQFAANDEIKHCY